MDDLLLPVDDFLLQWMIFSYLNDLLLPVVDLLLPAADLPLVYHL